MFINNLFNRTVDFIAKAESEEYRDYVLDLDHREIENKQIELVLEFKCKVIISMKAFYSDLIKNFKTVDKISLKIMWNKYRNWKENYKKTGGHMLLSISDELNDFVINNIIESTKIPRWVFIQD